jgi:hypothetical protein
VEDEMLSKVVAYQKWQIFAIGNAAHATSEGSNVAEMGENG